MAKLTKESNRLRLKLTKKEKLSLIEIRDKDTKAYLRERAAALLKIAEGQSPHAVAKSGLLKERDPDAVYSWVYRFVEQGGKGLIHKPRRKSQRLKKKDTQALKKILLKQTPQDYGSFRTRWSLKTLKELIDSLKDYTQSGIWHLLRRHRFSYKRGREWQESPDEGKPYKIRRIRGCLGYALKIPPRWRFCCVMSSPIIGNLWLVPPGGLWAEGINRQSVTAGAIPVAESLLPSTESMGS